MKKLIVNPIGKTFGNLKILSKATKRDHGKCTLYLCLCVCGRKVNVAFRNLEIGDRKNCSVKCRHIRHVADLIGKEINNRIILRKQGALINGQYLYAVRCKCGRESIASEAQLKRSNGCNSCANVRHGHCKRESTTRVHRIWAGMKSRCSNPNMRSFEHYGGRGIKVCDRWLYFDNFLADMGGAARKFISGKN